jgi:AhpD family alkylhydroperoxidase
MNKMTARMTNVVTSVPGFMDAMTALHACAERSGLPAQLLEMVALRASQINGCSVCVDMHTRRLRKVGEPEDRVYTVAAWRDAPYFTDAERAALALAEAATRLSDREDPVPDAVWNEAAKHYDEPALAALLIAIANINVWNRLNVATRQISGAWTAAY